jgi:heptosyltransferase-3
MWGKKSLLGLPPPDSILVMPPDGLGDLICWLPVLRFVVEKYPFAELLFPIDSKVFSPVLDIAFSNQKKIEFIESSAIRQPDLVLLMNDNRAVLDRYSQLILCSQVRIGLAGGAYRKPLLTHAARRPFFRGGRHEVLRNQRVAILLGDNPRTSLSDLKSRLALYCPNGDSEIGISKPYVVLHPFSRGHGREWPIEQFKKLATLLIDRGFQVALTGSQDESEKIASLFEEIGCNSTVFNLAGKLDLKRLISVLNGADCVVASSTGPLHLASALGARAIGLYPPRKGLNPLRWGAVGAYSCAISKKSCSNKTCSNGGCACMQGLEAKSVMNIIEASHASARVDSGLTVWSVA